MRGSMKNSVYDWKRKEVRPSQRTQKLFAEPKFTLNIEKFKLASLFADPAIAEE
jgi:hypothetical protein